ncbi:S-adenosyl-L-methionine-dependent methyltransferase [Aspergillus ellipticus CBS 707.79]|uniref:catechol O-methyltransferase n=1 Tax=Aspergillus ellipticus CBS 707.79 TaxID=1448320 RepID=A0A319EUW2_9EURO|nr:S-adenosyl-L-methionine-dependent methyltransferase [Aspergillus ellipticus CBS 707.79]
METPPEILAKYPSLKKMEGIDEEDIVESHDGREVTLLKYIYNHPELESHLRGSPSAILAAMDEFAAQEDFLINIGPDKASKLDTLIREYHPRVVVELGGYVGYSAILFGSILRDIHSSKGLDGNKSTPKIYSLELDPLIASIAMNLISLAGLSDIVEVVVGSSAQTLQRFHDQGALADSGIDLLFLDHVEELYEADVKLCEKLGFLNRSGAVIIADNVVRPGAPEYRSYMRSNPRVSKSWGLPGLIVPGEIEDELEISIVG